ncbi:glucose PTS transporter subunit IIA [Lacrimispora sp. NSJ-141]|uniref:Glucose PTS transporter subunit IIA n=1 Tax=Lientehia hominis TaxID=2897778 RepID=A0AAP2WAM0_9FIRM|nr:PTS transporter subunit IIBCA [Lientehia hominis]MCD2493572.1 glucose PTS transporter subunit IIA [Lientehia hominis]
MDYRKAAQGVYDGIGGKDNIVSAAHCATRLRLVIADNGKCDKEAIENIEGVKGVFFSSGQLQVIFGTGTVNKVFEEFISIAGISGASKEEVKQAASARQNPWKRMIKTLGDVFVPIIPAIVASGLLMGLLEGLSKIFPAMAQSGTYTIIHLFSNAAFVFLPILIGISAAKTFGGNIYLGAVIGMIMIHTDLLNAWSVASAETIPTAAAWFGLYDIRLVGYQGHVIPVVIAVWFMSKLEKKLHKIVPEIIDLFVTPLVTVLVTGYVTLTIFGPVFSWIETGVLSGVQYLITLPFGIGSALAGAVYAPTVVAGVHHMYNALEAGLLSANNLNTWMPIATAANVAQGAAALALAVKTKNKKLKSTAFPSSLSAFMGITEPAIFGINLRYTKCFAAGCIGGFCGALVAGITGIGASAYGITGIFGYLITTEYVIPYTLVMAVSFAVAFGISWMLYKEPKPETVRESKTTAAGEAAEEISEASDGEVQKTGGKEAGPEKEIVYSPLSGKVISMKEVPDETFAAEVLGKGFAVHPEEGTVTAPFDGTVETVYDTGHAIGLTGKGGAELLIHVGINTVELNGTYFETHVSEGDEVKTGQVLLTFELEKIRKAGYDLTTPVIVTNTDEYQTVAPNLSVTGKRSEPVLELERI